MHNLDMAQVYRVIYFVLHETTCCDCLASHPQLPVLHKGLHSDKELGVSFLTMLPVLALRPTCLIVPTTDSTSTTVLTLRMRELFAQEVFLSSDVT